MGSWSSCLLHNESSGTPLHIRTTLVALPDCDGLTVSQRIDSSTVNPAARLSTRRRGHRLSLPFIGTTVCTLIVILTDHRRRTIHAERILVGWVGSRAHISISISIDAAVCTDAREPK